RACGRAAGWPSQAPSPVTRDAAAAEAAATTGAETPAAAATATPAATIAATTAATATPDDRSAATQARPHAHAAACRTDADHADQDQRNDTGRTGEQCAGGEPPAEATRDRAG